ncbi:MAG: ABC transporter ATP-binding protein [Pseudomonadota bacterium]
MTAVQTPEAASVGQGLVLDAVSVELGGKPVLKSVSLGVAPGERLVLAGPSGSGKSTLLRAVAGLCAVQSGSIHSDGQRIDTLPSAARDVAMMFQSYALFPHLTVLDNLTFGLRARGIVKATAEEQARGVAATLGLAALLARRPAALSGGERQRVALGRALLRRPKALLLDEPLSSLDTQLRSTARAEIVRAHAGSVAAMLLVTHDQAEAMALADRLGILKDGVLQQLAPPREVYARPANRFVAQFLGSPAMNLFEVRLALDGALWWRNTRLADHINAPPALSAGGSATLGLRPEQLSLPGSRWAPQSAAVASLGARITAVEAGGDHQIVWCEAESERLAARTEPEWRATVGESVQLTLHLDSACWFEPEGEGLLL